ncbi:hypothetical protein [Legionella feeleii]|uniref:Transmembrane protein n=1 Tax=Legionella feeleii TaxID=453 RepID=A0A0W0U7Q2_9GAMM|nr:hypothetical protein [Legionella feeleii]KTD03639.1 hypothetical protein Lfee_0385 [Legionella feeleii]SPX59216.1 Uncharacterised protein [Legionella feeleii]
MKKFMVTLLLLSSSILLLSTNIPLRVYGVSFVIPSKIDLSFKIGLVLGIFLCIFWLKEDFQSNKIFNKIKLSFHRNLRLYMERKGSHNENLKELYTEINPSKDLYYIDGVFILKTGNNYYEGNFRPPGYTVKMNIIKYYFFITIKFLRTNISWDFFQYIGLFSWALAVILIFTFQLVRSVLM